MSAPPPPAIIACESTLTAKYQTTVPQPVRERLRLAKSDKIRFVLRSDGSVVVENASVSTGDPVLGHFLKFLERDILAHPGDLAPVSRKLMVQAQDLVRGIDVDLNAPLAADDE